MSLIRGTTPTITFKVTSDVDFSDIAEIWLTVADFSTTGKRTYKLSENEVALDPEEKTITASMSQEDTLQLKSNMVQLQIRLLDKSDLSYATPIFDVPLSTVLEGGVITNE